MLRTLHRIGFGPSILLNKRPVPRKFSNVLGSKIFVKQTGGKALTTMEANSVGIDNSNKGRIY